MADPIGVRYTTTRDGTHIAYRVTGSGPEIVFIPPWMSSVEFDADDPYIGPTLQRLESIGRVATYDKRGSGMSDPLADDSFPTLDARVDELESVLDAAGMDSATIFTGADGAAIALVFAARCPTRVDALCLYAPFACAKATPDYPIGYSSEVLELLIDSVHATWGRNDNMSVPTAPSMADNQEFVAWMAAYQRRSGSPNSGSRFLRTAVETDVRLVLPLVRVPTVVVHRRDDPLIPLAAGRYVADNVNGARFVELEGTDHFWAVGDTSAILDVLEELVTGSPAPVRGDRQFATVLFTDIVGSTEHAASLGDRRWRELLDAHHIAVRRELSRFGGQEIATTGDGFLATFAAPGRAIICAIALRDAVRSLGLEVRVGLHAGEIEVYDENVAGIAVHIGARIAALATPGQILVSGSIPPLVFGANFEFADRGVHDLKGVPGQWAVLEVLA